VYGTGALVTTPAAGGHAVFNEGSVDADFRVESNGSTHMLFVEGGANRVGINNSDPSATLHVSGTYGAAGFVVLSGGAQEHYWYMEDAVNNVFNIASGSLGAAYNFKTNDSSRFKIGVSASTFSTNITLNQLTTFPTTGFISHTNGFLYAEGGSNGIILRSASGGAQMMKIQPSEVSVNDDSADMDFRVESANNANAFRVDAGADQVRTDAVFVHDADGANQPFYITRSGGLDQGLKVTMDDNNVMLTSVQDETSGANFIFYSTNATTSNLPLLQLDYSAGAVFNESGVNYQHVRMESDTNTHAFYLNAVNGYIGMGAGASPTQPLSVGARTGANLNYINGTTNSVSTASGILISDTITSENDVGFGLLLANNANNNNARSPIIGFSALSASDGYNHLYAAINARKISNGADTNWNMGQLEFSTGSGTGPHIRAVIDKLGGLITTPIANGHTVFNEDGVDADFRVETDNYSNFFVIDAAQDTANISKAAAGNTLIVSNSSGNGSGIECITTSMGSASNNTSCFHFKGITQGIASYGLRGNGSSTWTSDERLKRDIVDADNGYLDSLNKVRLVNFKWKNDPESEEVLGVVAQEIEKIFPELVVEDDNAVGDGNTYKSVSYSGLNTIALKAIQELSAKVETLEARLAALES
tara:strand:- start:69 stop:2015 length:1947 start_codon:yes stop_codon:yes gene_type:complete